MTDKGAASSDFSSNFNSSHLRRQSLSRQTISPRPSEPQQLDRQRQQLPLCCEQHGAKGLPPLSSISSIQCWETHALPPPPVQPAHVVSSKGWGSSAAKRSLSETRADDLRNALTPVHSAPDHGRIGLVPTTAGAQCHPTVPNWRPRPRILKRKSEEPVDGCGHDRADPQLAPSSLSGKETQLGAAGSSEFSSSVLRSPKPPCRGPPSPIFFSNTSKPDMTRPPARFMGADATTPMLERMREGSQGVIKHQLAKGSIETTSTAASSSIQGAWPLDLLGTLRSPDGRSVPHHLQSLQSVSLIEYLEHDDRPTFIVDLSNPINFGPGPLALLFCNASLRASECILGLLSPGTASDPSVGPDFERFKSWVVSYVKDNQSLDVRIPSTSYRGLTWTCLTMRRRYRVVSANAIEGTVTPASSPAQVDAVDAALAGIDLDTAADLEPSAPPEYVPRDNNHCGQQLGGSPGQGTVKAVSPETTEDTGGAEAGLHMAEASGELAQPSFDWTRIAIHPGLPEHILFARSIDWASTPLGPIEHWPADLRTMSNLIMGSPNPSAMYWGREYTAIYNEAYTKLAAQKHPMMMGSSYKVVFAEIWDIIEPVFDSAWNWGQATMKNDDRLFLKRNNGVNLEETYFNWAIIPLVGGDGNVVALYNPAFEGTSRKITERRMLTLREIGAQTSTATDIKTFWGLVLKAFEYNEFDIPFCMIYSTSPDESESEVSSLHSGSLANPPTVVLEGALGVPANHPTAVSRLDLRTSEEGFAPYMRESMSHGGAPIVIDTSTLPPDLVSGFQWRGFGDPCTTIVVFPVHPTPTGDAVAGFIVMGTNPRRPYDEDFELFVQVVSRQLATSMAAVALFEEEIRKGQRAARIAALDRQELSLQLRLRTQEAVESEYKFSRMAEFAPVGIFITDNMGKINYCNDMWWQISRHPRAQETINTWMQSVCDEDRPLLQAVWERLVVDKVAVTHEFRFKSGSQADEHTWVLMSAFPERDGVGDLKRIFGCFTDITAQKAAETFQRQRREEAVELKRQQESFIDMTSHEMRNPLSAILQCADEIANGLARLRKLGLAAHSGGADINLLLDGCIEAANTISLCASHQKRIVDDTLTFSKLDSQLIAVTPVEARPVSAVHDVLKMFESEIRSNDIYLEFRIEKSYEELGVDRVKMDPSRLRQVLINLMTNAIKFTSNSRDNPSITVTLGASRDNGDGLAPPSGLDYFPSRSTDTGNLTDGPEWGTGEKIYLHFAVTDTGPGLDSHEKKLLFQRFSQASPRTHVQYGGFGLGLYICRTLSELQGGQISVVSEKGVGSTFAFYIKARKVDTGKLSPPPQATLLSPLPAPARSVAAESGAATLDSSPDTAVQYCIVSRKRSAAGQPCDIPVRSIESTTVQLAEQSAAATGSKHRKGDSSGPGAASAARLKASSSPVLEGATHGQTLQSFNVLIVEDNVVNQRVLQRQLMRCGNNTLVANNGKEALETLRRSRYWRSPPQHWQRPHVEVADGESESEINVSVILMDVEMPVMDGMTCARRIRELEHNGTIVHHIPIIAVTAYARPEQIEMAKAAGMDDVISKPFRIPELIPKIEELVTKYNTILS